jgi:hypothetical protein
MISTYWQQVALSLGLYCAIATFLNRVVPKPSKGIGLYLHYVFIDWPSFLPSIDFKGLFGLPVNVPYLSISTTPQEKKMELPPIPKGKASLLLPFLALAGLGLSSCYCWQQSHLQEPKCVIEHQLVQCSENSVVSSAPGFVAFVEQLIEGGTLSVPDLVSRLIGLGFKDIGCIIAALEADFSKAGNAMGGPSSKAMELQMALIKIKADNHVPEAKFCVKGQCY